MVCSRCGASVSLWNRDLSTGLCPQCREEVRKSAQAQAEQEAEAARQAEASARDAARKLSGQDKRDEFREKCPACGSTRFRCGRLPDAHGSALTGSNRARFRPEENWVESYALEALACLTCGHVRLFLFENDRAYLERESSPAGS